MTTKIEFFTKVDEGPYGKKEREYYRFGKKVGHVDDDIKKEHALAYSLWKNPPKVAKVKAKAKPRKKK